MRKPFIEQAIETWLEGYSVIPVMPHVIKLYSDFEYEPFQQRQPTVNEMCMWGHKYPEAGVGIIVAYPPNRQKTIETIKSMQLERSTDIPAAILSKLKDAIKPEI